MGGRGVQPGGQADGTRERGRLGKRKEMEDEDDVWVPHVSE